MTHETQHRCSWVSRGPYGSSTEKLLQIIATHIAIVMAVTKTVVKAAKEKVAESSHPTEVIQYHITLWMAVTLGLILLGALYHFLTSFERDDPVLYSQLGVPSKSKTK